MSDAKKVKKMASSSLLPLSMEVMEKKNPLGTPSRVSFVDRAKKKLFRPSFLAVKLACLMALISAVVLGSYAGIAIKKTPCDRKVADSSGWCIELTDPAGAKVLALRHGQLWVSGVQAAAALLGLLLSGCRSSRSLGFVAVAAGAVNLCMEAVVGSIFIAAAPRNYDLKDDDIGYIVLFSVLNLICLLVLIVMGGQDNDYE